MILIDEFDSFIMKYPLYLAKNNALITCELFLKKCKSIGMTATFGGPNSVEEFKTAGIDIKVIRQD